MSGIGVFDPTASVSAATTPANNSGSGIQLFEPGAYVARNTANDNGEWGINGVLGTIDGGGNRASGNAAAGAVPERDLRAVAPFATGRVTR